jgi:hypothetical protein
MQGGNQTIIIQIGDVSNQALINTVRYELDRLQVLCKMPRPMQRMASSETSGAPRSARMAIRMMKRRSGTGIPSVDRHDAAEARSRAIRQFPTLAHCRATASALATLQPT